MNLIVIDDEEGTAGHIGGLITKGSAAKPALLHGEGLLDFFKRIEDARSRKAMVEDYADDAIIMVDYDLQELSKQNHGVLVPNGRELAWMIRRYVRCGAVVAVNEPQTRIFPLSVAYDPISPACIHIRQDDLAVPSLWGGRTAGYAPWHWPNVVARAKSFHQRREELKAKWEMPLSEILGIPDSARPMLPIVERIGQELPPMSPAEIAKALVPPKEIDHLTKDGMAAVVESVVSNWLHYNLLWRQEIVVDAPHLAASMPFLLESTTRPALLARGGKHPELQVKTDSRHEVKAAHWFDRPVWWHSSLRNSKAVVRGAATTKAKPDETVFLEDASKWDSEQQARGYECEGFFPRRFVARTPPDASVTYTPKSRLEQ